MENGGMSDISLPPLPALEGASEAGSQDACSENNEVDIGWCVFCLFFGGTFSGTLRVSQMPLL